MISKENIQKIKEYVDKIHELNNSIIEKVVSSVCMITGIDIDVFYTRSLAHDVTYAKRMVWYILRKYYDIGTKRLSDIFGYSKTHIRKSITIMDVHIKLYNNVTIDYNQVMLVLK